MFAVYSVTLINELYDLIGVTRDPTLDLLIIPFLIIIVILISQNLLSLIFSAFFRRRT